MANPINSALLLDVLSERAETVLPNVLAPLRAFSKDFSTDELIQGKAVQVPLASAGSTTLTNPTDFEAGDGTLGVIGVTCNHYSQPFHISAQQHNQKLRLESLALVNLNALAQKITDVITALITAANYTGTAETIASASFAAANAKSLWGKLTKSREKYLLLDPVAYAQLLPVDRNSFDIATQGAYGFKGVFAQNTWTGAIANCNGFACSPEAMAIAAGLPQQVPGLAQALVDQRVVQLEALGLAVQMNVWVSTKTRALWASYDVMFGAAVGQATAGIIVKSA